MNRRSSKFAGLHGKPGQLRECYTDIRLGNTNADSYVLQSNETYLALPWAKSGTVAVIPVKDCGQAVDEAHPLIDVEQNLTDLAFHPFDDSLIAISCQDGAAKLYRIPEGGLTKDLGEFDATASLQASDKRMLAVNFHPFVSDLMATFTTDKVIKLWDVSTGQEATALPSVFKGMVCGTLGMAWDRVDGSRMAVTSKDKKMRIFDPRGNTCAGEADDHPGAKGSHVTWLNDKVFTVGFTRTCERMWHVFDPKNLSTPLAKGKIDNSPSSIWPFFDQDTGVLYLGGKGDGNIRYYELVDDSTLLHSISEFKSSDSTAGLSVRPKRSCNVMNCELMKFFKLTPKRIIPIRFECPRQNMGFFQDDLFPDSWDGQPSATCEAFMGGADASPNLTSMNPEA